MPLPDRKTARLRFGRVSIPGARYFLTICTRLREPVFAAPVTAARVTDTLRTLHVAGDLDLLAATVMPDHAHLLFALGSTLTLGQTMAKFKNLARDLGRAPWRWQDDGFEHRLRPNESAEDYAFYIFMNPYRARLIAISEFWPCWLCPEPKRFQFTEKLKPDRTPPPEWLGTVEEVAQRIVTR